MKNLFIKINKMSKKSIPMKNLIKQFYIGIVRRLLPPFGRVGVGFLACWLPLLRGVGVCFFILAGLGGASAQNIGINGTGAAPDASALLDVDAAPANDKGLLIPRVSLTQTTSNAPIGAGIATSLLVYNTATINDVTPGYYYWGGTAWVRFSTGTSSGGTTVSMQTFTSSGTYTPTVGTQYIVVHMVGGGAGGWNGGSGNYGGGGGGSGEYATGVFSAAVIGANQPITIGVGGAPNAAGGTTSLGALLTAVGAPANLSRVGGVGGTGGTGVGMHIKGGWGGNGIIQAFGGGAFLHGGTGGSSFFGGGGRGNIGGLDVGQNGNAYGSGGGGNGYDSGVGTWGANAGAGAAGVVIIYEYQ